jgi:hypothetical protein
MKKQIVFKSLLLPVCVVLGVAAIPAGPEVDSIADAEAINFPKGSYGTTINGQTFQVDAIASFRGWQYATWFEARGRLCVGRRRLPRGAWQRIVFDDYSIRHTDVHNVAVLGISPADGTIHLAFDHHVSPLHYRVSKPGAATEPERVEWNAALFSATTSELRSGIKVLKVTYPEFFTGPDGRLRLYYRTGHSGQGESQLAEYDPDRGGWTILGAFVLGNGEYQTSPARNAYHNGFDYGPGNRLHTTWVWREEQENSRYQLLNCHDLMYAYSDDHGRTWRNNAGELVATTGKDPAAIAFPGIIAWPIPYRWGLMNQVTQTVDRQGRVPVVMWQNPPDAPEATRDLNSWRYVHYWRDQQGRWRQRQLPFFGRKPSMLADTKDNLYVVFTKPGNLEYHGNDPGGPLVIYTASAAKGWQDWHEVYRSSAVFAGEPRLDKYRWAQDGVLSIYAQEAARAPGEPSVLHVLDFAELNAGQAKK